MSDAEPSTETAPPATRPPKVLQVLPSLGTGGVERTTVDVAAALAQAGWHPLVVSAGGPMTKLVERAGARHIQLPVDSKNPWTIWRNVERLAEVIRSEVVDLVHARSRAPAWSAHHAARKAGVPFVTTFHGIYGYGNPLKRAYNAIMTRGDRVIANSFFTADHIAQIYGVGAPTVVPIPRGIDPVSFDPARVSAERMIRQAKAWRLPEDRPVVLLPGRLTRWKGQTVLIEAMSRLGRRDVTCLLVGDDQGRNAYRSELESRVRQAGLEGVVLVTGPAQDMPAAYMLADVVVSASTDPEAFGRVAVEAQAMGRPVVATDHGGSRETVIPGETGWLVPPGDAGALAYAIGEALALTPAIRAARAIRARDHALATYTVERMCAATIKVYREILEGR
ncbi:MAG: glycosyltransferase family 4 protein [Alphaproteobacteria bacterium]|nr:glycosyltransferase family 4 protein [Alphaproteobacteria bacterium]